MKKLTRPVQKVNAAALDLDIHKDLIAYCLLWYSQAIRRHGHKSRGERPGAALQLSKHGSPEPAQAGVSTCEVARVRARKVSDMAEIREAALVIEKDEEAEIGTVTISGRLVFNEVDQCLLRSCAKLGRFRVGARLRAEDYDKPSTELYAWDANIYSGPDLPAEIAVSFTKKFGYSKLDEDPGPRLLKVLGLTFEVASTRKDELLGELIVHNKFTGQTGTFRTNTVEDTYL